MSNFFMSWHRKVGLVHVLHIPYLNSNPPPHSIYRDKKNDEWCWNFKRKINRILMNIMTEMLRRAESEFNEFKPRFKFSEHQLINKSWNIEYNFKWNQPYLSRISNLSRGSSSLNSASGCTNHFIRNHLIKNHWIREKTEF